MSMARHEAPSPLAEIDQEILAQYAAVFVSRWERFAWQQPNAKWVGVQKIPLTLSLIESHIRGQTTIGVYALDQFSMVKWIAFDADEPETWQQLVQLAVELERQEVKSYPELSARGGHLWLFAPPLSGRDARRFGKQLLKEHDIGNLEIYPRQDAVTERAPVGSFLRLPLGVHQKTKRQYYFVTPEGTPLAPTIRDQLAILANPQQVPKAFIRQFLKVAPREATYMTKSPISGETEADLVKNAISVYDFVSQHVDLDARGRGLCPFHDDHHESFSVKIEDNYWHCFAGCKGQTIVDFWMQWRGIGFKDALRELEKMLLP